MSIFKKLFSKKENNTKGELFIPLTIKEVKRETAKAVTIIFSKPDSGFEFESGQYLTLRTTINNEQVQRPYSLCSLPTDNELRVTVKEIEDGYFSKYANQSLTAGDIIEVMPPSGLFKYKPTIDQSQKYVCIAGGSGITPIFSIIKNILLNETKSSVSLIYGNRAKEDIIFLNELIELQERFSKRFQVFHILSEKFDSSITKYSGFLSEDTLTEIEQELHPFKQASMFYLCGPGPMIEIAESILDNKGIDSNKIKKELFSAPVSSNLKQNSSSIVSSRLYGTYNGQLFEAEMNDPKKTILDVGLETGHKIPFSCLNGVCSTCSAKLVRGKVKMNQNFALEDDDIAEGYILTCQSHPVSEEVEINWDDNKI